MATTRSKSSKRRPSAKRPSPRRATAKRSNAKRSTAKRSSSRRISAKRGSPKRKSSARKSHKSSSSSKIAHISGFFAGSITSPGQIHFVPGAKCNGNVQANSIQIDGTIKGNIFARNQVKLGKKAHVKGNISAFKFVAEEGACFDGHIKLGRRKAA